MNKLASFQDVPALNSPKQKAPQALTTSFADLGGRFSVADAGQISVKIVHLPTAAAQTVTIRVLTTDDETVYHNIGAQDNPGGDPATLASEPHEYAVASVHTVSAAFTAAVTNICTATAHGLATGDTVLLTTSDTLPAGLSTATEYFVTKINANTFYLSLTPDGDYADVTDTGTGTHTFHKSEPWTPYAFPCVGQYAKIQVKGSAALGMVRATVAKVPLV